MGTATLDQPPPRDLPSTAGWGDAWGPAGGGEDPTPRISRVLEHRVRVG